MGINFARLHELRAQLVNASRESLATDEELIRLACAGSPPYAATTSSRVVARTVLYLYQDGAGQARELARGALLLAIGSALPEIEDDERNACLEAAVVEIETSAAGSSPSRITLNEEVRGKALAIFDRLQTPGAHAYSDDSLISSVETFSARVPSAPGIPMSRFLDDLRFLAKVLGGTGRPTADRTLARAALAYFADQDDAIPDELGLVGLLDDAFIARTTADRIEPTRASTNAAMDLVLAKWPFLHRLRLDHAGQEWNPSTGTLLNLGAMLLPTQPVRSAIVVPTPGILALMLAMLAAFAQLYEDASVSRVFRPPPGTFVAPAGDERSKVEIAGYTDAQQQQVPSDLATYVQLTYRPRRGEQINQFRPVEVLDRYVRVRAPTRLLRTELHDAADQTSLGALERLFGLDRPFRRPRSGGRIVAVAPYGVSEQLLSQLSLFGAPLIDVLPSGRTDAEGDLQPWGAARGEPALLVTNTSSDAARLIEKMPGHAQLIATLDTADRDENALARVLDQRASATIVVPERAFEVQDHLATQGFEFLDWNSDGITASESPSRRTSATSHPLRRAETAILDDLSRRLVLQPAVLDENDAAWASLSALKRSVKAEYDDDILPEIADWIEEAFSLLYALDALPVVLPELSDDGDELRAKHGDLHRRLESARTWSAATRKAAIALEVSIGNLLAVLSARNPKREGILSALQSYPEALVDCADARWAALAQAGIVDAARRARRPEPQLPVVRFEWLRQARLSKVALPPCGSPALFILYQSAARALTRLQRYRRARVDRHWSDQHRWKGLAARPARIDAPADKANEDSVEDWALTLRGRQLERALSRGAQSEELVETTLVQFVDDWYAFFSPDRVIYTATHLMDKTGSESAELREKLARQLVPGDLVVMIEGSDRDVIRDHADRHLPPGMRDLARTWHRALLRAQATLGSERAVIDLLRAYGCHVTDQTIRAWLRSSTQIGPMASEHLDAIAHATGDLELTDNLEECRRAIGIVRSEHQRASQEIARRVFEQVRNEFARGREHDAALLDDQVRILTVERIQLETARVPPSEANRVRAQ